ncbi:hypothetical protein C8F01DRAFT_1287310 [Mycena amicta]|nr:hypothetical protein C8F01DRAFT_1287310 [Mycena amicta]
MAPCPNVIKALRLLGQTTPSNMAPRPAKMYAVQRISSAKAVWTRVRRDQPPVFQWVYLVEWSGYSADQASWEPSSSFDPPYEAITFFWSGAVLGGRDWEDMAQFQSKDQVFLDRKPEYKPGVLNFHLYDVRQFRRDKSGLVIPKSLLEDLEAELVFATKEPLRVGV